MRSILQEIGAPGNSCQSPDTEEQFRTGPQDNAYSLSLTTGLCSKSFWVGCLGTWNAFSHWHDVINGDQPTQCPFSLQYNWTSPAVSARAWATVTTVQETRKSWFSLLVSWFGAHPERYYTSDIIQVKPGLFLPPALNFLFLLRAPPSKLLCFS